MKQFLLWLGQFLTDLANKIPDSTPPTIIPLPPTTCTVALDWDVNHPERKAWSDFVYNLIQGQLFDTFDRALDATRLRPDYASLSKSQRSAVWAEMIVGLAKFESDYSPVARYTETTMGIDPITNNQVVSEGLLSLSYQDKQGYPFCQFDWSKDKDLSPTDPTKTILQPLINLDAGVRIMARQIEHTGKVILSSDVYWSTLRDGGKYSKVTEIIAMVKALDVGPKTTPIPIPSGLSLSPWMDWMRGNLHEKEITGSPASDFDKMVFSHTTYGSLDGIMQPGCAATACAALELTSYKSPHNAAAISFKAYGSQCELKPGCIVVFQWASGGHHVSFCDHIVDNSYVACLGGNQSHEINVSIYSRKWIIATRWPTK